MSEQIQLPRRASVILAAGLCLLLTLLSTSLFAQETVRVRFDPGRNGTTVSGAVFGSDYVDYVVGARVGQVMTADLSVVGGNGDGTAYFNIVPAGRDHPALFNGSTEGNRARVTLPSGDDWAIRVYLMGNARNSNAGVRFSLNIQIAAHGGAQGGGGHAQARPPALLPEEDFFVVRLSGSNAMANVRAEPTMASALRGKVRNGTAMANVGGCTMRNGQQWCHVQAAGGGVRGWVAARFLALPGPGGGGGQATQLPAPAGGRTAQVVGVASNDVLNVRSGPGAGNDIIGALANGDRVQMLDCREIGGSRWCRIEMLDDMRGRGWVNARFLR